MINFGVELHVTVRQWCDSFWRHVHFTVSGISGLPAGTHLLAGVWPQLIVGDGGAFLGVELIVTFSVLQG